jgi:hypothetical protein
MATYKVTKKFVQVNEDKTKTLKILTVKTGLTFAEAKAARKADKALSITKE